jgi:hypothetical protein
MGQVFRIPGSLGKLSTTATPLYLQLFRKETSVLKKWRNITNADVIDGDSYILPPPKIGMGLGTHSENMDEVQFWQVSSVGDKARMILGDTVFYGVSRVIEGFQQSASGLANYEYLIGKSSIPKDLTALQFKGTRKRAYNFSFELFAAQQTDYFDIAQWVRTMHIASMIKSEGGGDSLTLYTPSVFTFSIHAGSENGNVGGDVTNNWFFSPKPCMMIGFNSSAVDYQAIDGTYSTPARVAVNMILAEIEPVVFSSGVKSVFEVT